MSRKAYRKLARRHHPDRNNADPGAIGRFRRITAVMLSEDFKNGVASLKQYGLGHATFHGR